MPEPVLKAQFLGVRVNVLNTTVNRYTFNYTLELPRLTQIACGKDLTVTATGHYDALTKTTKILVKDCKFVYFIHLFFFFEVILSGKLSYNKSIILQYLVNNVKLFLGFLLV